MATNGSASGDGQALTLAYRQVIGRDPTAAELALGLGQLASGTSLSALRAYLAATGYAAAAVGRIYTDVLGRAATAPDIAGDRAYLAGGGSLAALRGYLANTAEAATAVKRLFETTVGRIPVPYSEVPRVQAELAGGASLAGLRAVLGTSVEEGSAVALTYQHVLGRAPTAAEAASAEQAIAAGRTTIEKFEATLAGGTEFAGKVNAAFRAALGRPANAVELAADRSEILGAPRLHSLDRPPNLAIDAGFSFKDLQAQLGELTGGTLPAFGDTIQVNPQTIAGSPGLVYGILGNDALVTTHPVSVRDQYAGTAAYPFGLVEIDGFNPATDILQLQSRQAASFGTLSIRLSPSGFAPPTVDSTGYNNPGATTITTAGTPTIILTGVTGVAGNAITPANLRFV